MMVIKTSVLGQLAGVPPHGPVSNGLGGIVSPLKNGWSTFNNPAGLATLEQIQAVFGYQTIFDFTPFNTVAAAISAPTEIGTLSFGAHRFGDELFSSQMVGLAFAHKLGIMSLAVKTNALQYEIDGFGKRSVLIAEIGSIADLTPELSFGMHIYNFTQAVIAVESQEKIPTIIRISADYHPTKELSLFIEGEKDVDLDPDLKLGLAYRLIEELILRTGFSSINNRHSFGAGFKLKRFVIDYGLRANQSAGTVHNFGLTLLIND